MQLINLMAFKNSMDVRKQMKNLNLFELRDALMIRCLIKCASEEENHQEDHLLNSLTTLSYETIASKALFKDS